jgi:hypothetical protein
MPEDLKFGARSAGCVSRKCQPVGKFPPGLPGGEGKNRHAVTQDLGICADHDGQAEPDYQLPPLLPPPSLLELVLLEESLL